MSSLYVMLTKIRECEVIGIMNERDKLYFKVITHIERDLDEIIIISS